MKILVEFSQCPMVRMCNKIPSQLRWPIRGSLWLNCTRTSPRMKCKPHTSSLFCLHRSCQKGTFVEQAWKKPWGCLCVIAEPERFCSGMVVVNPGWGRGREELPPERVLLPGLALSWQNLWMKRLLCNCWGALPCRQQCGGSAWQENLTWLICCPEVAPSEVEVTAGWFCLC